MTKHNLPTSMTLAGKHSRKPRDVYYTAEGGKEIARVVAAAIAEALRDLPSKTRKQTPNEP
ncbi:hypothetical protein [Ereboglobus luteus]|nr:hypothetical protein [Ereboglobus luteus]